MGAEISFIPAPMPSSGEGGEIVAWFTRGRGPRVPPESCADPQPP